MQAAKTCIANAYQTNMEAQSQTCKHPVYRKHSISSKKRFKIYDPMEYIEQWSTILENNELNYVLQNKESFKRQPISRRGRHIISSTVDFLERDHEKEKGDNKVISKDLEKIIDDSCNIPQVTSRKESKYEKVDQYLQNIKDIIDSLSVDDLSQLNNSSVESFQNTKLQQYYEHVTRMIEKRNNLEAEDKTQETFLSAVEHAKTFKNVKNIEELLQKLVLENNNCDNTNYGYLDRNILKNIIKSRENLNMLDNGDVSPKLLSNEKSAEFLNPRMNVKEIKLPRIVGVVYKSKLIS